MKMYIYPVVHRDNLLQIDLQSLFFLEHQRTFFCKKKGSIFKFKKSIFTRLDSRSASTVLPYAA